MAESIGLAEFIAQVRRELLAPAPDDSDRVPLLSVEDIDLECKVTVTKQGKAGLNINVVQLGGTVGRDDVHTVHVKLSPLLTREARLELMRQAGELPAIEHAAVEHMLKGVGERRSDQY
jgi:hypothetical protein